MAALPARAAVRPLNIVILLIDDLGWADVNCDRPTVYETPNIDRLAASGMRFSNAYAACPVCSPTRASILTGKYPARLHLTDWIPGRKQWPAAKLITPQFEQQLALEEVTIAESLKPAGYVSASIGKWHLGKPAFYPEKQGFDLNVGGTEAGHPPSYFPPYGVPGVEPRFANDYLTDNITDRAVRFIEANRDRPFFLYFANFAVHLPLNGKQELVEKYRVSMRPDAAQHNPVYAAMVDSMDQSVGAVMNKVKELGIEDRTVVFFLSDNGGLRFEGRRADPVTSNAPLRAGKGHLYEGGIRVPFVVRWPGVTRAGAVCDVPVASIDLYPTILRMTGAERYSGRPIDGVSLVPLLRGAGRLQRDALYWHYPHYSNQGGVPSGAVREGHLKLIEFYEDGRLELFDLLADTGEQRNLAARMPGDAERLRRKLARWRRSVNAAMPVPNPAYDPAKADQHLAGVEPPTL